MPWLFQRQEWPRLSGTGDEMTKQMKKTDRIFLKALSRGLDGRILEEDPGISEEEWEAQELRPIGLE